MGNRLVIAPYVLLIGAIILIASGAWSSTAEAVLTVSDKSIAGTPTPPTPVKEDPVWNLPKGSGWEKPFFDKHVSPYNFPKSQFRLPNGPVILLKSPGM